MTPDEITEAYNVLSENTQNYVADEAAKIGNSQRSLGTLAAAVASPSNQTSGLANYTYDRTLRPTVNSLAASLTTTGKAQALNKFLSDSLRTAKNNYEDAQNAYTVASTTPSSTGSTSTGSTSTGSDSVYNEDDSSDYYADSEITSFLTDPNTGLLYDAHTGHVWVNGKDTGMSIDQYTQSDEYLQKNSASSSSGSSSGWDDKSDSNSWLLQNVDTDIRDIVPGDASSWVRGK